jgi:hypothetical protein
MDNMTLNGCVNKFRHLEETDEVLMLGRNTMLVLRLLRRKVSMIRFWLHFPAQLFPHSLLHIERRLDVDIYGDTDFQFFLSGLMNVTQFKY